MHDVNIQSRVPDFIKIVKDQVGQSPIVLASRLVVLPIYLAMFLS